MADSMPPPTPAQPTIRRGFVKQVLSGDAIVLQGQATNGPPPEATVYLSNVSAPRLGKRPTEHADGTADEPFAWHSREFLRKKIVGQMVTFMKEFTASSGRDHGKVFLGGTNPDNAENVAESAVAEGWLEVRQGKVSDDYTNKLLELQEQAKSAGKGKWGSAANAIREVQWVIDNPRSLVDNYKQKPVDAVVEMVRDGSTVRVLLLPSFEYITLQLSGVRAPACRAGLDGKIKHFPDCKDYFRSESVSLAEWASESNDVRDDQARLSNFALQKASVGGEGRSNQIPENYVLLEVATEVMKESLIHRDLPPQDDAFCESLRELMKKSSRGKRSQLRNAIYTMLAIVMSYLLCNGVHLFLTFLERTDSSLLYDSDDHNQSSNFYIALSDTVSICYMVSSAVRIFIYCKCNPKLRKEIKDYLNGEMPPPAESAQ